MTYLSQNLGRGIRKLPQGTVALVRGKRYRVNELPDRLVLTDSDYQEIELDNRNTIKISDETYKTININTGENILFTIARYTLS